MARDGAPKQETMVNSVALVMPELSSPMRDDADLVPRAQAGEVEAFEELYRQNAGRVYALCLRMTRDATQAEDLSQEAFVRAWRKLNSFRGDSAFSTWLHRLTVNLVLTHLRSHARRAERVVYTDDIASVDKRGVEPVAGKRADLEAAIAKLPEGARQVFVLYEIEGYRHNEIGEIMGIATGTSKAQLHRARKMLRESLTL